MQVIGDPVGVVYVAIIIVINAVIGDFLGVCPHLIQFGKDLSVDTGIPDGHHHGLARLLERDLTGLPDVLFFNGIRSDCCGQHSVDGLRNG